MLIKTFRTLLINRNLRLASNLRFVSAEAQESEHAELAVPENTSEQKLLKLAVIGLPNAGKSTFINNLMDRKVN